MDGIRAETVANIRALLVSVKGKVPVQQLEKDYRTLLGERLPYNKLGFKSLEDFLQSVPTLSVTKDRNGVYVDAKTNEKTSHISELVNNQKSAKKKPPPKTVRFNFAARAPQTSKWRPKNVNRNQYENNRWTSPRMQAVSHNQFVNRSPKRSPPVASKIVIPDHSSFAAPPKKSISDRLHLNSNNESKTQYDGAKNITNKADGVSTQPTAPVSSLRRNLSWQPSVSVEETTSVVDSKEPLQHTKRRITQKMSEISLDRDSGNSSPTTDFKMVDIPPLEFIQTGDPIIDLKTFVEMHNIKPFEIKHSEIKPRTSKYTKKVFKLHSCTITVGDNKFLSYPQDFTDALSAEQFCAKQALEALVPKYNKKPSLLLANSKDVKDRIPPMLQKHTQGIWSWQIEADYVDKYHEDLPSNWLEIIDSCDCVAVEKLQDKYVLQYCKPGTVLQKGQKLARAMALTDVSVPSNTVQFADNGQVCAQITCVMSLNEVWCRQWDTPEFESYSDMVLRMEAYYTLHGYEIRAENIQPGSYYVANYDCNWYRVRALEIRDNDVNCFLIDFGDEFLIPKSYVYKLKREYATSQAQAFVCRLAGLEDLYELSNNSKHSQNILGKQVILETVEEYDSTENDQSIPVVMYDFDDGHSINEELISLLTIESALPTLKKDTVTEVYVSNIEPNGDIYIQIRSPGFESLQELLHNLEQEIAKQPPTPLLPPVTKANSENVLYFTQNKETKRWHRAKVIDWSPKGDMAQIYFVDEGNAKVIKLTEEIMYPLDKLSDVISQYPYQAVRICTVLDKVPDDFVKLASAMMPVGSMVLLKVTDTTEEEVPLGEFYKRSQDGGLFCINKSIAMESELRKEENNNFKGTKKKLVQLAQSKDESSKNVPSGGSLSRPILPAKGQYFEVKVPFSVNPWNFFVQPFSSAAELMKMMKDLQKRYNNATLSPLQIDQIIPGKIYASKHEDGHWYRTSVLKVINHYSISVFYCDFGYYANLSLQKLLPLDAEFTKLPYQALKAKLAGIKPKKDKWTMEDCEYFNNLVKGNSYVSILIEVEKDELYDSDIVLKLILVDTSSKDDVFINDELIKKDIAVKLPI